ncbi:MAG TPA: hypothetical protein VF275_07440 [Gammaproteobacteria bacterium]
MNPGKTLPALLLALILHPAIAFAESAVVLPADFRNDRVFVLPQTVDGETVEFYTDSGGGFNAIKRSVAERLGLDIEMHERGGENVAFAAYPQFLEGKRIPLPDEKHFHGGLVVVDDDVLDEDGFLGGRWFADKVWEFDYDAETLRLLKDWNPPKDNTHSLELGFQVNADGERTLHFPRMTVEIDGESMDMLLDTGAGVTLTEESAPHFGVAPGTSVGGSFITRSTFEKWVKRHPDWLVVDSGDRLRGHDFPMIRVPEVTIAGHTVGPVWFAQRPDRAFHERMAQWMDAPTEGAIGGSAFKYFRMIVDYPNARAWFWKP